MQAQNLICILDVDIQGVRRIKETDLNPIYISIQPPSMEILVKIYPHTLTLCVILLFLLYKAPPTHLKVCFTLITDSYLF